MAFVITILFIVETFSTFFTSPASFLLVMLWLFLIDVVLVCSAGLLSFFTSRLFPPVIGSVYENDAITRLRLGD
jgi:hypothetical protein